MKKTVNLTFYTKENDPEHENIHLRKKMDPEHVKHAFLQRNMDPEHEKHTFLE